jgi:hypothetical protein
MEKGLPVSGYRPQSQESIALVNENKRLEEMVLQQIDKHRDYSDNPVAVYDQRWVALARTQIEQGFMALNRAVFKPERVKL